MRILPIALVERDADDATLVDHAQRASRVTHGHPRAQVACALYVLVAARLLAGGATGRGPGRRARRRLRDVIARRGRSCRGARPPRGVRPSAAAAASCGTASGPPGTRSKAPTTTARPSSAPSRTATTPTRPPPSPVASPASTGARRHPAGVARRHARPRGRRAARRRGCSRPVDPIRVDAVDLTDVPLLKVSGRLGMTFTPGKRGPGVYVAYHRRNLADDVQRLRDAYSVDTFVLLIADHELDMLGVQDLPTSIDGRWHRAHSIPYRRCQHSRRRRCGPRPARARCASDSSRASTSSSRAAEDAAGQGRSSPASSSRAALIPRPQSRTPAALAPAPSRRTSRRTSFDAGSHRRTRQFDDAPICVAVRHRGARMPGIADDVPPRRGDAGTSITGDPVTIANYAARPNRGPGLVIRALWFLFIGWWLSAVAIGVRLFPVRDDHRVAARVHRLQSAAPDPDAAAAITRRGRRRHGRATHAGGSAGSGSCSSAGGSAAIYLGVAWFLCVILITLPIGLYLMNRVGGVMTLLRY